MVTLSQAAAQEIQRLRWVSDSRSATQQEGTPQKMLRVTVKEGGCATFYYGLEFTQEKRDTDRCYSSQGIEIVVDADSDRYLQGVSVDYSEDLMGGGFRFKNPNASKTCSCSLSFTS
ncbi:iron-sulfur cluster assembly accessory protein [Spirulina sp. CS-785/01]|uniref:HesB/IscA family protein n=1 Tax=Spirulina sp. CS-785/01 TaxID=3021716 RepID=UPI0023301B6A|nr:iron-sulfur cluster assembly accessory protein [Spirulina sp. CS-785/01]MDB9314502.1 iron-sulfur cluster assembly accessory protein [Spirulina sp. CS-785/01]